MLSGLCSSAPAPPPGTPAAPAAPAVLQALLVCLRHQPAAGWRLQRACRALRARGALRAHRPACSSLLAPGDTHHRHVLAAPCMRLMSASAGQSRGTWRWESSQLVANSSSTSTCLARKAAPAAASVCSHYDNTAPGRLSRRGPIAWARQHNATRQLGTRSDPAKARAAVTKRRRVSAWFSSCRCQRHEAVPHSSVQRPGGDNGASYDSAAASSVSQAVDTLAWQRTAALLEKALHKGRAAEATQLADQLLAAGQLPSRNAFDRLIQLECRIGDHTAAQHAYAAALAARVPLRYMTYQALITRAFKAGDPHAALAVFADMQAAGLQPNAITMCAVISGLGRQQRRRGGPWAQRAYALWQQLAISGAYLDDAAYRTGMDACIGAGRLDEARRLFDRLASEEGGSALDARSYNILLKGYSRAGQLDALEEVLEEMQAAGVAATRVTYNTVIDAYVTAGDLDAARQVLEAARAEGCSLDVWSYTALVKGFAAQGNMSSAARVLAEMRGKGVQPNEVTYTTLIDGYVNADNTRAARALLREMLAAGVQPNAVTYNTLLKGCVREGRVSLQDAFGIMTEMAAAKVPPSTSTFNALMSACLAARAPAAALRCFRQMAAAGCRPDAVSYTTLIQALSALNRMHEAVRVFKEMDAVPGGLVDGAAVHALIDALARAGRLEEAAALLPRATSIAAAHGAPPPVEAYGAVMGGHVARGHVEPALALLQAFHAAGGQPDAEMFDSLIDMCVRNGAFRRALQVVRTLEALGGSADKARIKRALQEAYRRQAQARSEAHAVGAAAFKEGRNEGLERLKFWLGLPNTYYNAENL